MRDQPIQRSPTQVLEAASAYLLAHGDVQLVAFAEVLSGRREAAAFPIEGEEAEVSPASLLEILELLDTLGRLDSAAGERFTSELAGRQDSDGGWGEAEDASERLKHSGRAAGLLARSPFSPSRSLRAAEAFLTANWSEERVRAGSLVDIDTYFHWFANHPGDLADEALQWCGRELTRGFRSGAIGPVPTAQVFARCGARALPAAPLKTEEVLDKLLLAQREDGSFRDAYFADDPHATAAALRGLLALA